eukprot:m.370222 g.370222  ORF g.370222 m.370222 type:complete len:61 (+) comp52988_c0_seq1:228-410(+)
MRIEPSPSTERNQMCTLPHELGSVRETIHSQTQHDDIVLHVDVRVHNTNKVSPSQTSTDC